MKAELVLVVTSDDTPIDGTILDVFAMPAGTLLYDIQIRVKTAWSNGASCDFGFNLNGFTPIWIIDGSGIMDLGSTVADDNAVVSGPEDGSTSSSVAYAMIASYGLAHLPCEALQDTYLQFRYLSFGFGDPPGSGEAEIRVIYETPQEPPAAPVAPAGAALVFPGDHADEDVLGFGVNVVGSFHAARPGTVTVTLASTLTGQYIGVMDPTGQNFDPVAADAGDIVILLLGGGDWIIYITDFSSSYQPGLTGSGSYTVAYA